MTGPGQVKDRICVMAGPGRRGLAAPYRVGMRPHSVVRQARHFCWRDKSNRGEHFVILDLAMAPQICRIALAPGCWQGRTNARG